MKVSSKKVIFEDIDGVLNGHQWWDAAQSCQISLPCVLQFNRILRTIKPEIVLSSAWRYMIHGNTMTLKGFAYMLQTHGVDALINTLLIDVTQPDEICPKCQFKEDRFSNIANGNKVCIKCGTISTRGAQIQRWLDDHPDSQRKYVVLDDDDMDISNRHPFVQTNPKRGLTRYAADKVIRMLSCHI